MVALLATLAGGNVARASAQWPVTSATAPDISWHAPSQQVGVNNLTAALGGSGVHGFVFSSDGEHGAYNWCNMPHVRRSDYPRPGPEFQLQFVELVRLFCQRPPTQTALLTS